MAVITSGKTFANGEQLSADKLNQVITAATFNATDAVDGSTMTLIGGAMAVADGGIATAKIADSAVTKAKIADSAVTKAKIENVANMKALGNTSGSAVAPQEVAILDENDMSSDSDTSLATQQSIKAYVDGDSSFNTSEGYQKLPGGLIIQFGHRTTDGVSGFTTTTFPTSFATKCMFVNIVEEGGSYRSFNIRNIGVSSFQSEAITTASNEARYFAIGF